MNGRSVLNGGGSGHLRDRAGAWYAAAAITSAGLGLAAITWFERSDQPDARFVQPLAAAPSDQLNELVRPAGLPFAENCVASIRDRGYLTVTAHVALADCTISTVNPRFGDGNRASTNQYWGALYGVETHLARSGAWERVFVDDGNRRDVIRRVVFARRVEPGLAWQARGVDRAFDLYLLAQAWPSSHMKSAMEQPLRDALSEEPFHIQVAGQPVAFGAGSAMVGYVGQNRLIVHYADPFCSLKCHARRPQTGVFFICWKSAVYLYQGVVERGLYPVLFTRDQIVPEAYILEGLLEALSRGEIDDAFPDAAAESYTRYQRGFSPERARAMFFR